MKIKTLGKSIRERRKALGLDQRAFCSLCGISIHTLSNIESGKGNPTLNLLNQICDVLGLEIFLQVKKTHGQSSEK